MRLENAVTTFEKDLGSGVFMRVSGVPVEIVHADGYDDLTLFDAETSDRLWRLVRIARRRMADGDTDIRFDFGDGALDAVATGAG